MVEVHVFNAFMIPAYRETQWFEILNFINGLVAPSFIFISGFVFVVASQRKLESFRTFGSDFWRQIWRIGLVMIIGYYLHLPFFSLRRMLTETTESGWLQFYQTDVLQCIAVGLFILFMVRIFIRNNRWYKHALLFSGLFVCGLSPFLSDIDFVRFIHPSIAAYINGRHFSLFPLFPWMGFMLFAGYCAANYIEARRDNRERKFIIRMAAAGFLMLSAGLVPALWQYRNSRKIFRYPVKSIFLFRTARHRYPVPCSLLVVRRLEKNIVIVHSALEQTIATGIYGASDRYLRAVVARTEPLVLLRSFIHASDVLSLDGSFARSRHSRFVAVGLVKAGSSSARTDYIRCCCCNNGSHIYFPINESRVYGKCFTYSIGHCRSFGAVHVLAPDAFGLGEKRFVVIDGSTADRRIARRGKSKFKKHNGYACHES